MNKKTRKVTASLLMLSFIALFFGVYANLFVSNTQVGYSFDNASKVSALSTGVSQYAIAKDGSLLKRIQFQGIVSDFLVKFVKNIAVAIPLDNAMLKNTKIKGEKLEVSFSLGNITPSQKTLWTVTSLLVAVVLLMCTWQDKLNAKRQSLLSVIARSRAGGFWNSNIYKT